MTDTPTRPGFPDMDSPGLELARLRFYKRLKEAEKAQAEAKAIREKGKRIGTTND